MEKELLAKAKQAKTPEELMALAQENGMEMTEETAKTLFAKLNRKSGEIPMRNLTMCRAAHVTPMTAIS